MKKVLKFLCLVIIAALIAILVLKNGAKAEASPTAHFAEGDVLNVGDSFTLQLKFNRNITSCSIECNDEHVSFNELFWQYEGDASTDTAVFAGEATSAGNFDLNITISLVTYATAEGEPQETDSGSASFHVKINDSEDPPPADDPDVNITINGSDSATINKNDTVNISCIKTPDGGTLEYRSSDDSVASVSQDGVVTGTGEGTATITATYTVEDKSATSQVTVIVNDGGSQSDDPSVSINVNGADSVTLNKDDTANISCTKSPDGGTLEYRSSDDSVASVTSAGVIKGENTGTATITATYTLGDKSATSQITVIVSDGGGQQVLTLNPASVTLNAGGKTATITSNIPVEWDSSNTNVVSVDKASSTNTQAILVSNNAGSATITATAMVGGKKATVDVTVEANAAPVITPSSNIKMEVGKSVFLSADQSVTWSSSNTTVATIDGDGLVIAKSAGETTITAKNKSGKSSSIKVTVVQASSNGGSSGSGTVDPNGNVDPNSGTETTSTFAISPTKTQTLDIGGTLQIKVTKGTAVSWKSSKPAVATVDNNGKVTANAAGTTIITAVSSDGSVAQVKVRVRDANGEVPDPGSESNTDVPSTGEASTSLLLVLGVLTCIIAMFIFRKKTK